MSSWGKGLGPCSGCDGERGRVRRGAGAGAQARLALLEEQGILVDHIRDRDELLAEGAAQLPANEYRRGRMDTAERAIAAKSKEVQDLLAVIGDPETVCDEGGWLPESLRARHTLRRSRR
jgi:hypothetical protein